MATLGSSRQVLRKDTLNSGQALQAEVPDFSLVLGGPLYQLLLRAHLGGEGLEMMHRRIIGSVLLTWLPRKL